MKDLYLFPFTSSHNPYINIQKKCFSDLGYRVKPFDKALINRGADRPKRGDIIVVNWLENIAFDSSGRVKVTGLSKLIGILFYVFIFRIKLVWVKHNQHPHQLQGVNRYVARILMALIKALCWRAVSQSPRLEGEKINYVPHPLYREITPQKIDFNKEPRYLFFGSLKPYKKLDRLLNSWPKDVELRLAGQGDKNYVTQLLRIIDRRQLKITLDNRYIPEHQIKRLFLEYDVVVLPHLDGTPIVSGVYYLAKSFGNIILYRESVASDDQTLAKEVGSYGYTSDNTLDWRLNEMNNVTIHLDRQHIFQEALINHSNEVVKKIWRDIFCGRSVRYFDTKKAVAACSVAEASLRRSCDNKQSSASLPLVSAIIVTRNRRHWLEKAVNSVLAQSYTNIELVIVDDSSDDDTPHYLEQLSRDLSTLKTIRNSEHQGACFSRNRAINMCSGEFVAGLDDDDEWLPKRIEILLASYSPKYSLICASDRLFFDNDKSRDIIRAGEINVQNMLPINRVGNQVLTRLDYLKGIGGFDESLPSRQDYDVWLRLIKNFGHGLALPYVLQHINAGTQIPRISLSNDRLCGYWLFYKKYRGIMTPENKKYYIFQHYRSREKRMSRKTFLTLLDAFRPFYKCVIFFGLYSVEARRVIELLTRKKVFSSTPKWQQKSA